MEIDLPEYFELKKLPLKIETPRTFNTTGELTYFPTKEVIGEWEGVYLLVRDDKVIYVGETTNLRNRMISHTFRKKADFVYFYELPISSMTHIIEGIYKYKYIGKARQID